MSFRSGEAFLLSVLVAGVALFSSQASAQEYRFIKNRWKPDQYIHIEHGSAQAGSIQPGWWSAQWEQERVPGRPEVRLRSKWKRDQYLHIEHGRLASGRIQPGWWSAMWTLEPVQDTGYVRFRNRWKPDQYLHIEHGALTAGKIAPGWWSAMWTLERSANAAAPPRPRPSPPHPSPARPPEPRQVTARCICYADSCGLRDPARGSVFGVEGRSSYRARPIRQGVWEGQYGDRRVEFYPKHGWSCE